MLFDIVHPADVLFFLHPIRMLEAQGHKVFIVARDKDVTLELLQAFQLPYRVASRARAGLVRLGLELLSRDVAMWRCVREFRPDILCGFGGVAISHIGRLLGIPAISFYDTERATLQQRLTLPFISHLYVPDAFTGPIAKGRTTRFSGTKDLSYFHPENFHADREVAVSLGFDANKPNYFLRLVGWGANHDVGRSGLSEAALMQIVERLSSNGCLHLSSEAPLPGTLQDYAYRGPASQIHHLLAHCDLYVGESATMAAEAVLLGVPAVYAVDDFRGYIRSLAAAGLVCAASTNDDKGALKAFETGLKLDLQNWKKQQREWLAPQPNLARYVVEAIERHAGESPHARVQD